MAEQPRTNPMTPILICTVGGSHAPIVTAIRESGAGYVCFICTDRDPGTGKEGSLSQITKPGNFIKARFDDEKPTLPNIPAQCGLTEEQFSYRLVPSDDLDAIYTECRAAIQELRQQHPAAQLIADYTGGTKSMTAALVLAALAEPGVELQLVTGNRVNLRAVHDGAEATTPASIDAIQLERSMQPYLDAWQRHAYAEAEAGLRSLPNPRNPLLRSHLNRARDLSTAYAAWDRFDHATALKKLQDYAARLSEDQKALFASLAQITGHTPARREAAQLLDLYRNAERRYAQGRHDDAVARWYRLLEWTAQWVLLTRCNVRTDSLPEAWVPDITPNRDGDRQAGLFRAWQLLAEHTRGPLADWFRQQEKPLLDHLKARNSSILAHGVQPVSAGMAAAFHGWLAHDFCTALLAETAAHGIRALPPQLPRHWDDASQG